MSSWTGSESSGNSSPDSQIWPPFLEPVLPFPAESCDQNGGQNTNERVKALPGGVELQYV